MASVIFLLLTALQSDLDEIVPEILAKDKIPGAVVLAGDLNRIDCRKAYGDAKLDTIWDLASVTKIVATTTAAMKLVEEGRLSLDDPLGKHLPMFQGRDIALRELLTHRSGLPAYHKPKSGEPDEILLEFAGLKDEKKYRYS